MKPGAYQEIVQYISVDPPFVPLAAPPVPVRVPPPARPMPEYEYQEGLPPAPIRQYPSAPDPRSGGLEPNPIVPREDIKDSKEKIISEAMGMSKNISIIFTSERKITGTYEGSKINHR